MARLYRAWRVASESVAYVPSSPYGVESLRPFANEQARLFTEYRNALDLPEFDKAFDSRGALQSSALEELCRYLLAPVVTEALAQHHDAGDVLLGHFDVYQGTFFTATSFAAFSRVPTPHFPNVNMDFVIAKRVAVRAETEAGPAERAVVYLPAVAIECKTYLDRTRYHGADGNATMVKGGFPGCLYLVVAEMLKLNLEGVNVHGSRIDHIYVLRRSKNVDLKRRRAEGIPLQPVSGEPILHLVDTVRGHLKEDWSAPESWERSGRLKEGRSRSATASGARPRGARRRRGSPRPPPSALRAPRACSRARS